MQAIPTSCNSEYDSDKSESRSHKDSDSYENEDQIDSDIEAALYSQIHHLQNPCYKSVVEETENSQAKETTNEIDQCFDAKLNECKAASSSVIIISEESDGYNAENSNNSDIEFVGEVGTKINSRYGCGSKANVQQKKWWKKFVCATYNDDGLDENIFLENDKNVDTCEEGNKVYNKLRPSVDLDSTPNSLVFSSKGKKAKQLTISRPRSNATTDTSKRKRKHSDSTSNEDDDAFKHSQHEIEGNDILINVKSPFITVDLTKDDETDEEGLWNISSEDINRNSRKARYYSKQMCIICSNCSERGHIARYCKKSRKLPVCYLCGEDGHFGAHCLNPACSRCLAVGHKERNCTWANVVIRKCSNCKMWDHLKEECPDIWRKYHMTVIPGPVVYGNSSRNKRVFCYNCAKRGHFGHECNEQRMDPHTFPTSPFIVNYFGFGKGGGGQSNVKRRKEKCIRQSNQKFVKKSKQLVKKNNNLLTSGLPPYKLKRQNRKLNRNKTSNSFASTSQESGLGNSILKQEPLPEIFNKAKKKRKLLNSGTRNKTSNAFASTSHESKSGNLFGVHPRKKKKRKSLTMQNDTYKEEQINSSKKNKKKKKKSPKTIQENDNRNSKDIKSSGTLSNIFKYAPEISFSMSCMKLFSGKSFGNP